jgi:hypothetical protein
MSNILIRAWASIVSVVMIMCTQGCICTYFGLGGVTQEVLQVNLGRWQLKRMTFCKFYEEWLTPLKCVFACANKAISMSCLQCRVQIVFELLIRVFQMLTGAISSTAYIDRSKLASMVIALKDGFTTVLDGRTCNPLPVTRGSEYPVGKSKEVSVRVNCTWLRFSLLISSED